MRKIAELAELIGEETGDACRYAKMALKAKEAGDQQAASVFAELAKQEAGHADKLHDLAVKAIKAERDSGREVPEGMEAVWEWHHARLMDDMAHAKQLIAMI